MTHTEQSSSPPPALEHAIDWLMRDQFDHGEWGKCEVKNLEHSPRTLEVSRLKPNVFTSCHAAYALIAAGASDAPELRRFLKWLTELRDASGWWTSAVGSRVPIGGDRGWSAIRNIRHTAKALDILLLREEFRPDDAGLLRAVTESQLESGAYAQAEGGNADIWATAYVMNLILRARSDHRLRLSIPRGFSENRWSIELTTHLDKARAWLCSARSNSGLWEISGADPMWVTQGVIAEVGGDLMLRRPDVCEAVATTMRDRPVSPNREAATAWGLLLLWGALPAVQQQQIFESLSQFRADVDAVDDTFDMSCLARVLWHARRPDVLKYYLTISDGHESALDRWNSWAKSEYEIWCVQVAAQRWQAAVLGAHTSPQSMADSWETIGSLIRLFRETVEKRRGWELLWTPDGEHRNEKSVQTAFWNTVDPIARELDVFITREAETGRGPVDFMFANGANARVLIEFKLAESPRLFDGLESQLIEYMEAMGTPSAFFICVGFEEDSRDSYNKLRERLKEIRKRRSDLFIESEFVDARRRAGASASRV